MRPESCSAGECDIVTLPDDKYCWAHRDYDERVEKKKEEIRKTLRRYQEIDPEEYNFEHIAQKASLKRFMKRTENQLMDLGVEMKDLAAELPYPPKKNVKWNLTEK